MTQKFMSPKVTMEYKDREKLKQLASTGKCLPEALTMIAHWMRQNKSIPFPEYAANWAAAEQRKDVSAIRELWPLKGNRMIADNYSEWDSFRKIVAPQQKAECASPSNKDCREQAAFNQNDFNEGVVETIDLLAHFLGVKNAVVMNYIFHLRKMIIEHGKSKKPEDPAE